ncbi:MAG TPA: LrgB family protein [Candidatus Mediterraneibacter stercoravium]|uniref:LrgB family protein n=1 Tax=Candidatus Mediterraneibacter stercoravium TaxID=2838685 RepID=A0A9D2G9P9_9FIRM|nr:LrgB family protein [Candidatus Mediterraneibacter stercoravium]
MKELFASPYFGVALSVITFGIGVKLNQKLKTPICNPLIIAIVLTSGVLLVFGIPYESYNAGGEIINMFLAPATACLAVAIYTKRQILREYWLPILTGCAAGSAASMASVYLMCRLFGLDDSLTVSLLPKSVTTPIAVSIAEPAGGVVPITVVAVIGTGILGGILAPFLIKLFHITDPVAAGLAIGASSHAVGTSKAIEIGEVEGAMSGLAIGICGIITVLFSMLIRL